MTVEKLLKSTNGEVICSLYLEKNDKWEQELKVAEVLENYSHRLVKEFYPALQFTDCNMPQLVIII